MVDVLTFGEAMVRLAPPAFQRLEQTTNLDVEVGGAELNTAVGLVRLGRSAQWVSRVTDNALGRLLLRQVRGTGVDTSRVLLTPAHRVGVYFLEFGAAPRPAEVLYDRAGSAFAHLAPGMLDWPTVLTGVRWLHLSGITPALSADAAAESLTALQTARSLGVRTSLDLNYRSKLWTPSAAGAWARQALPFVEVLIASRGDAAQLLEVAEPDFARGAETLRARFGVRVVASVERSADAVWRDRFTGLAWDGQLHTTRIYEVEVVDRLGAGDAFAAGLIHGLLADDLARGVAIGTALGALQHTLPGDLPWVTAAEVEAVLAGASVRIRR
jgi:2-dehydro-3-deoxygluconokinase